jgi:hypothetical protein
MHDPLSDRLVVESMATALDLHSVKLDDATAVATCLLRAGYPGKTIGRLMGETIARACELKTLRTELVRRIDCSGAVPPAANEEPHQQHG